MRKEIFVVGRLASVHSSPRREEEEELNNRKKTTLLFVTFGHSSAQKQTERESFN